MCIFGGMRDRKPAKKYPGGARIVRPRCVALLFSSFFGQNWTKNAPGPVPGVSCGGDLGMCFSGCCIGRSTVAPGVVLYFPVVFSMFWALLGVVVDSLRVLGLLRVCCPLFGVRGGASV